MFTTVKVTPIGDPVPDNACNLGLGYSGCDVTFTLYFILTIDFYVCDDPSAGSGTTSAGCPPADMLFVSTQSSGDLTQQVVHHFSNWDITKAIDEAVLKSLWSGITADAVNCSHGSLSSCAWTAGMFFPPDRIIQLASLAKDFAEAIRTGVGLDKAIADLDAVKDVAGSQQIAAAAAAQLLKIEGDAVSRDSLNAKVAELLRRYSLGLDPAKAEILNKGEMQTALLVEAERGVQLSRDVSGDLEWYDQNGRGYDAVGNSPAQYLDVAKFTQSIASHLLKSDVKGRPVSFIPVDVSTYTVDQISQIKAYISGLTSAEQARVFLVGDHA
jgi:hypothetical protein